MKRLTQLAEGIEGAIEDRGADGLYVLELELSGSKAEAVASLPRWIASLPTNRRVVIVGTPFSWLATRLLEAGFRTGTEYCPRHRCQLHVTVRAPQQGGDMYYLLDCRSSVGNCALWWRPEGKGYTCELREAGLYTKKEAFGHRDTDIPIPQAIAEAHVAGHVRYSKMQAWAMDNLSEETGKKWHRDQ